MRSASTEGFEHIHSLAAIAKGLICDLQLGCLPNGAIMQATTRDKEACVPAKLTSWKQHSLQIYQTKLQERQSDLEKRRSATVIKHK